MGKKWRGKSVQCLDSAEISGSQWPLLIQVVKTRMIQVHLLTLLITSRACLDIFNVILRESCCLFSKP